MLYCEGYIDASTGTRTDNINYPTQTKAEHGTSGRTLPVLLCSGVSSDKLRPSALSHIASRQRRHRDARRARRHHVPLREQPLCQRWHDSLQSHRQRRARNEDPGNHAANWSRHPADLRTQILDFRGSDSGIT